MIIIITHDKNGERKMETGQGYGLGIGGCKRLCPAANGAYLGYTISLSVSIKVRPLHWVLGMS